MTEEQTADIGKESKQEIKSEGANPKKIRLLVGLVIIIIIIAAIGFLMQGPGQTTTENPIKNQEDVSGAVIDIGQDVENLDSILDDIDSNL